MSAISKLDSSVTTDNGCCIASRYVTYAFADQQDRQQLQITLARVIYPYALVNIEGSGQFSLTVWPETFNIPSAPNPYPFVQPNFTLSSPALDDTNVPLNVTGNRAFIQIDSAGEACANWSLNRIDLGINTDPRIMVTGR